MLSTPALLDVLVKGLDVDNAIVRMRAADALEKVSVTHPQYLWPHKHRLMELSATAHQKELRWHLAQMLPRLELNLQEQQRAVNVLLIYCQDASSIVKTFAMQALADIAVGNAQLRPAILVHLKDLTSEGTPAMKARGRKLLAHLQGLKNGSA